MGCAALGLDPTSNCSPILTPVGRSRDHHGALATNPSALRIPTGRRATGESHPCRSCICPGLLLLEQLANLCDPTRRTQQVNWALLTQGGMGQMRPLI